MSAEMLELGRSNTWCRNVHGHLNLGTIHEGRFFMFNTMNPASVWGVQSMTLYPIAWQYLLHVMAQRMQVY
jgi:hypothetical protein